MTRTILSYRNPTAAIVADLVVLALDYGALVVLLIECGEAPHKREWALPGGFLRPDEDVGECARRELADQTGLAAELDFVGIFSAPDRHPSKRVVSIAHVACVDHRATRILAEADAVGARWWPVDALPPLVFDHAKILADSLAKTRDLALHRPLAARLLPATFTLAELQVSQEAILGRKLDKRNFRKEMLATGWYRQTGERKTGPHRPAEIWCLA